MQVGGDRVTDASEEIEMGVLFSGGLGGQGQVEVSGSVLAYAGRSRW